MRIARAITDWSRNLNLGHSLSMDEALPFPPDSLCWDNV